MMYRTYIITATFLKKTKSRIKAHGNFAVGFLAKTENGFQ